MKSTFFLPMFLLFTTAFCHAADSCCDELTDDILFLKEKVCDVRSKTSNIQSKVCNIRCDATEIKEKVCQLLADATCDFVITQKDIQEGNTYVIDQPGYTLATEVMTPDLRSQT